MPEAGPDPALVAGWLTARSIARKLPAPVPDSGGLRVDTGLPTERRRHVFARPGPGLTELGRAITDPLTVLKLCASPDIMGAYLPKRWMLDASGALMTCDTPMPEKPLPGGYRLELRRDGLVLSAFALAADGSPAASGHAVEAGGVFVFDRIETEPMHRRRGLGGAIVTALASARADRASRFVLVATPAGRALYESLGWRVESPYTTARLPSS